MNFRAAGFVAVAILLCGCSDADWDNVLSFGAPDKTNVAAEQVMPSDAGAPPADEAAPAPPPSYSVTTTLTTQTPITRADRGNDYCQEIARNTGAVATRDGMDGPAQQQAADVTYRQCITLYGAPGR